MKRFISAAAVAAICCLVAACNPKGAATASNNGTDSTDTWNNVAHVAVAYLDDYRIYLIDVDSKATRQLTEEADSVLDICYEPTADALFYLVQKNGTVRMRKAVFTDPNSNPTCTELLDTQLPPDEIARYSGTPYGLDDNNDGTLSFWTHPNVEMGPQQYNVYTIANNTLFSLKDEEEEAIWNSKKGSRFSSKSRQLVFTHNGRAVNLSDKLDIDTSWIGEGEEFHAQIKWSADSSKISFYLYTLYDPFPYGPICVANADGTHQQKLTDFQINKLWVGNRLFYAGYIIPGDNFAHKTVVVGYTNPADNSPQKVYEVDISFSNIAFIPLKQ